MNEKHKGGDHELMDHDEKFGHTQGPCGNNLRATETI